jgi:hypothetical protein
VEVAQQLVHIFVCFENGFKGKVFPEFITIAQLTVMETIFKIVAQGMKIDISIVGKIVCETVIAPVTVAKNDKFRVVIKGNDLCILVRPVQPKIGRHVTDFCKYPKKCSTTSTFALGFRPMVYFIWGGLFAMRPIWPPSGRLCSIAMTAYISLLVLGLVFDRLTQYYLN